MSKPIKPIRPKMHLNLKKMLRNESLSEAIPTNKPRLMAVVRLGWSGWAGFRRLWFGAYYKTSSI